MNFYVLLIGLCTMLIIMMEGGASEQTHKSMEAYRDLAVKYTIIQSMYPQSSREWKLAGETATKASNIAYEIEDWLSNNVIVRFFTRIPVDSVPRKYANIIL